MRRLFFIVVLLVVLFFLGRCAWQNYQGWSPTPTAANPPETPAPAASSTTDTGFVPPPPPPTVTFVMPPLPPAPPPIAEPAPAPVRPKPPATVRRKLVHHAAPAAPAAAHELAPVSDSASVSESVQRQPAPAPAKGAAISNGAFYVVQQKLVRGGTCYIICTIMGNPLSQYFGYAVSADEYNNAVPGLVYNHTNMADWRQVARIQ